MQNLVFSIVLALIVAFCAGSVVISTAGRAAAALAAIQ